MQTINQMKVVILFVFYSNPADKERIRKEVSEEYTVKVQECELKLNNAEAKIKG